MLDQITPLVLTYNEAPNISRALAGLAWAGEVVIVDSFSQDGTAALCRKEPRVTFIQRRFDDHQSQWNFGLDQISTPWALTLDADYILTEAFVRELAEWTPADKISAYYASFRYCIFGKALRASLYPPRAVLFNRERCRYVQDGHTQQLEIKGATGRLNALIHHDDRKSLSHWLWSQDRYANLEAKKLLGLPIGDLPMQDRLRRMIVPAPFVVLAYTLFAKGLIFEGWRGWYYVCQRTVAEIMLSLRLVEAKFGATTLDEKAKS